MNIHNSSISILQHFITIWLEIISIYFIYMVEMMGYYASPTGSVFSDVTVIAWNWPRCVHSHDKYQLTL